MSVLYHNPFRRDPGFAIDMVDMATAWLFDALEHVPDRNLL
jgi:hypothetical protein